MPHNAFSYSNSTSQSQTEATNFSPFTNQTSEETKDQKEKPLGERQIPWRYTLLNPFQMDIVGSKFFGQSRWVFILDDAQNMLGPAISLLTDLMRQLAEKAKKNSRAKGGIFVLVTATRPGQESLP